MATFTICDICGGVIDGEVIRLSCHAGVHPHDNKELRRDVDGCSGCLYTASRLTLENHGEPIAVPVSIDEIREARTLLKDNSEES